MFGINSTLICVAVNAAPVNGIRIILNRSLIASKTLTTLIVAANVVIVTALAGMETE